MSNMTKIAVIAAAVFFLPIVAIMVGVGGVASALLSGGGASTSTVSGCASVDAANTNLAGYQPDQLSDAATIVAVGQQLGVPPEGQVVAIAAALTESELHNLDYGDRDSLGLFQQRPSQGWGTPAQILDPTYAATQFYRHLLAIPNWQQMSVNDAAQAVQRSGRPTAYGSHEQTARAIVAAVSGATCTPAPPPASLPAPSTAPPKLPTAAR